MGLLSVHYIRRTSGFNKLLQHLSDARVLDACCQLSVAEGSGTALTELNIGFRVKFSRLPEALHRRRPCVHILTPFQNQRSVTCSRQNQGGENTRRSEAHYYGSVGKTQRIRRSNGIGIAHVRGDFKTLLRVRLQLHLPLSVLCRNSGKIHRIHEADIGLVPCVDGFLHNFPLVYNKVPSVRTQFF